MPCPDFQSAVSLCWHTMFSFDAFHMVSYLGTILRARGLVKIFVAHNTGCIITHIMFVQTLPDTSIVKAAAFFDSLLLQSVLGCHLHGPRSSLFRLSVAAECTWLVGQMPRVAAMTQLWSIPQPFMNTMRRGSD